jgi:integrase
MPKLTKRFVENEEPPKDGYTLVWDEDLPGFGLRVHSSGQRSYLVQYRNTQGRSRRMTLGRHGKITADEARKSALRLFASIRDGKDPLAERRAYIDAPIVGDLLDRYVAEHVEKSNRGRTREEFKRLVERHIRPQLGKHKVAAVTRQDVAKLHRSLADTPRQANLVLAICSKVFSLAEEWGMRPDGTNPCRHIARNSERHRERFLTGAELRRLDTTLRMAERDGLPWDVDENKPKAKHLAKPENRRTLYPRVITAAVELLLYTGCRLSEVLNLRWEQVDIEAGVLLLSETKAGRPQVVVINAPARQTLKSLPCPADSPWVLPSRDPARPLTKEVIESKWRKIREVAGFPDVRLHDLRHTVGTYAGQSGANAFLIRDLLRHKDLSMTGRYVNRADDPVRTLSELVGERISAAMTGRKAAEVAPMKITKRV